MRSAACDVRIGARDRELDALVLADRPVENDPLLRVGRRLVDEPVAVADALGGNQDALGVQAVEYVLEPFPSSPMRFSAGTSQVVEEQLVRLLVRHVADRLDREPVADRLRRSTMKTESPSDFFLTSVDRRRAREQEQQVRMPHPRDEHFLPVHHVAVALLHRDGLELRGVRAGGRARSPPSTACAARRSRSWAGSSASVRSDACRSTHAHDVHLAVHRAGKAARAADLLQDDGRFGDGQPRAAVLLGNQRRQPARLGQRLDECVRDSRAPRPPCASTRRRTACTARARLRAVRLCSSSSGDGASLTGRGNAGKYG